MGLDLDCFLELSKFDPRVRPGQKNERAREAYMRNREENRVANVKLVPLHAQINTDSQRTADKDATFGQRRAPGGNFKSRAGQNSSSRVVDGGMETSWMPSSSREVGDEDMIVPGGQRHKNGKTKARVKGVEVFGAGMEKGGEVGSVEISEHDRKGRTQRRKGVRSGSKNIFRRIDR
jgi:ribosome biogenesis protein ENP2